MNSNFTKTENPSQQSSLNVAAKDKFLLILNLPQALVAEAQKDPLIDLEPLQMKVHGSVVPTVQVPAVEVRYSGQSYNVSSHSRPNFGPLTINFVVDNRFKNYWFIWRWLNLLNTFDESIYGRGPGKVPPYPKRQGLDSGVLIEYQSNFSILGLDEYNKPVIEFAYFNAFPISLGAINYSYRDPELIESSVEFQFSQLEVRVGLQK